MFRRCSFYEKVPQDKIYLTIHDAVIAALAKKREILEEVTQLHLYLQISSIWFFSRKFLQILQKKLVSFTLLNITFLN